MTLLVALANASVAALIADRRITRDGKVVDEEYNKVTVLCCLDARMAIAVTVLATWKEFNTSEWIASTLHECGDKHQHFHELLECLRDQLQLRFLSFPEQLDRRISVLFCGYVYWERNVASPAAFVISNFEHGSSDYSAFSLRSIPADEQGVIIELAGQATQMTTDAQKRLRQMMRNNPAPMNLARFAVSHIRSTARAGSARGIGEQCNAAIIPSTVDTQITTTYHSSKMSMQAWSANVVFVPGFVALGVQMQSTAPLSGPDVRKKSPCWCGSGLAYVKCHMQKYGSISALCPPWQKPLPLTILQRPEDRDALTSVQLASHAGNYWCVTSTYD